jgi:hypothetical protein
MFRIKLDTQPIEQLENELDKFGAKALPYAIRDTLTITAFEASEHATANLFKVFTIRNSYTPRSIRYERARGTSVNRMESAVGSIQPYLAEQEEGFTKRGGGKHGLPIPTSYAAGQEGARPRTKAIKRINWLNRLKVARSGRRAHSVGQQIVQAAQEAIATGRRTIFLPLRHPGLYKVVGGRKTRRGWPRGAKLKMLYSLEDRSARTEAHPWLEPAVRVVLTRQDEYYRRAVIRQIEMNRMFRDKR